MTLALYRKYRPRTFAEVIGQDQVTEPLMQALRTGRLNHAYLFSGPRGCGKTSSARILARSLNCAKGPTPEPCGECDSCVALAPDGVGSIDVIEIDAASHGGVDDARDLRERAFFAPVASRFKVYIIDEAHMVSTQGFNALLKLVEEPPEYVKFVFATTEPEKVLGTIKSRTHHYPFRLVPPSVLRPYLEKLAKEEGVSVEPAVFPLVVRAGGGSIRDSLSVLDQLIAGAGVYGVTYTRAVGLLGVTDVGLIDEMTDALAAGDGAAAFGTIDRVAEAGHDPRRYTSDLLERFRDLIIMQKVPDAVTKGIIDAPDDLLERMTAQASRMGPATLSRLADIVHNGLTEMRGTTAPRLLLELLVARMLLPGADDSEGALLQRLERMERRLGAGAPVVESEPVSRTRELAPAPVAPTVPVAVASSASEAAPSVAGAPSVVAAPTVAAAGVPVATEAGPAEPTPAGALDAAAIRRVWDEVLATVRRRSPKAWAVAREAVVRDVHGEELVLVFQHAVHANMFGAQADLLVEAIREVFGGSWRVRAELAGDAPAPPSRPASGGSGSASSASGGSASSSGASGSGASGSGASGSRASGSGASASGASASGASGSGASGSGASGSGASGSRGSGSGPAASGASGRGATAPGSTGNAVGTPGSAAVSGALSASATDDDGEWPTPARPGGNDYVDADAHSADSRVVGSAAGRPSDRSSSSGGTVPGSVVSGASASRGSAASASASGASTSRGSGTGTSVSRGSASGSSASRGVAPASRTAPGRPTPPAAQGTQNRGNAARPSDIPPPDEPPFDPDYDTPPASTYEGFDPGDEPLDDAVDPSQARRSSEEQALKLLKDELGAEPIDG